MTTPKSPAPETRQPCSDIRPGDLIESTYLLVNLEQRAKKNGDPYFFLTLGDSTGQVAGVMWDNHAALLGREVVAEDFVYVEANAGEFNGAPQLVLRKLHRVEDHHIRLEDFLPMSPRPRAEMEAELDARIAEVKHPACQRLLQRLFGHERFRELFCTAPAAASIHQAYRHGLLEHTLNVVRHAVHMIQLYPPYSYDLLVTGGLLHDIGKIREFSWRRAITYTEEGQLLGHISIGANMVDSAIRNLQREPEGFPTDFHHHILHLILSHHGKLEYGSPVVPKTKEALVLHYADYADAYLTSYQTLTAQAAEGKSTWTTYQKRFEGPLYAGPVLGGAILGTAESLPAAGV
ncbi:MAG: HD domain-containing protein [Candidatus Sumerlaeia bacterium]|nr:HD domain-containing protein [Candidatus Sumerlaeia bacterium]